MKIPRPATVALAAGALALALVGCSSQGGRTPTEDQPPAPTDLTIALVTHSAPGDTFWDIVRKGAEDAAAQHGVELLYGSDPDGARQAQLVQQYTDQQVDGIAVSLAKPEAMESAVTGAVDADIPVVSVNAGSDAWKKMGVLTHFGQDERVAGEAVGEQLGEADLKHPLCVIHEQGNVGLEARCAGIASVLPDTEVVYVTGTDNSQIESTVTAKLQSTPDADALVGLNAPVTMVLLGAREAAGSDVTTASFDLNGDLVEAITAGDVAFTVDQQPYLQGYQAVEALALNRTGGFVLGGGEAILTGPAIVDADNVEAIADHAEEGIR